MSSRIRFIVGLSVFSVVLGAAAGVALHAPKLKPAASGVCCIHDSTLDCTFFPGIAACPTGYEEREGGCPCPDGSVIDSQLSATLKLSD